MNILLKQSGLTIILMYAFFNVYNILHMQLNVAFNLQLVILTSALYFINRGYGFFTHQRQISSGEIVALVLVLLTFSSISLQSINLQPFSGEDGIEMVSYMKSVWLVSLLWFFAGGAVAYFKLKESPILAMAVLIPLFLAFVLSAGDGIMVSYQDIRLKTGIENVSHLSLEKHVIVLLLLGLSLSRKTRMIAVIGGVLTLFVMGGRTSTAVFFLSVYLFSFRNSFVKSFVYIAVVGAVLVSALYFALTSGYLDSENSAVKDMLFIDGLDEDGSFQGRVNLLSVGVSFLSDQFLFGDPTILSRELGGASAYIHNILSAWQFYGFFVFIWIGITFAFCLSKMLKYWKLPVTPIVEFGSILLIYVLISSLVAKAANWQLLWFCLGFWTLMPELSRRSMTRSKSGRRRSSSRRMRTSSLDGF